jgi:hypothetical protein
MDEYQFRIIFLIGVTLLLSFVSINFVFAAKIQSGVTINQVPASAPPIATCGLELLSGVPINYGQLTAQAGSNFVFSADQKVTYSNTGNASAQVMVKGGNWTGGSAANPHTFFGPGWTHVTNNPNVDWLGKRRLRDTEIPLGQLGPGQTGQSYWQVRIPTNAGINGSLHQEVTIDLSCQEGATTPSTTSSSNAASSLGDKAPLLATSPLCLSCKIIPSQEGAMVRYLVTVMIHWPQSGTGVGGLLNSLKPQQGQVFVTDTITGLTTPIGIVKQGGDMTLSYTLSAGPGDEIYSYLRGESSGQQWNSERIKLGNTNPILHINVS